MPQASAARPAALGRDFKLRDVDDVNTALYELHWLEQQASAVEADAKKAVADLKEAARKELLLEIDGSETTVDDRVTHIRECIAAYLQKNQKKLFAGEAQTLQLSHGRVGYKNVPDAVVLDEGLDEKAVTKRITEKAGLLTRFAKWLCETIAFPKKKGEPDELTLASIITLKPQLDRTAVKKAWEEPANRPLLKKLGVSVETDRREWVIEPAHHEVSAPSA